MGWKIRPLVYLATPYSHPDPAVVRSRLEAVHRLAALIELRGVLHVTSGIYNHLLLPHPPNTPTDYEFWGSFSITLLKRCDWMVVFMQPGWRESVGVRDEISFAQHQGMWITYLPSNSHLAERIDYEGISPPADGDW